MRLAGMLVTGGAVVLTACSSVEVRTDHDPGADFSKYRTYRWEERAQAADSRVYNDLNEQRVHHAVDAALQQRGLRQATGPEADLIVGWHGSVDRKMDIETFRPEYGVAYNPYYGGWATAGYSPESYVHEWEQGTLVVDLADAHSKELVWRGSASKAIPEKPATGEKAQAGLDDAVARMFEDYPPGKKK